MYDLYQELKTKTKQLDASIAQLRQNGTAYAQAERDYKIMLRRVCLQLRAEDMAIGMIDKTCYGVPEVAELRFKRDVAKTVYQANMDAINALKLEIRLIENQIGREWSNGDREMGGY